MNRQSTAQSHNQQQGFFYTITNPIKAFKNSIINSKNNNHQQLTHQPNNNHTAQSNEVNKQINTLAKQQLNERQIIEQQELKSKQEDKISSFQQQINILVKKQVADQSEIKELQFKIENLSKSLNFQSQNFESQIQEALLHKNALKLQNEQHIKDKLIQQSKYEKEVLMYEKELKKYNNLFQAEKEKYKMLESKYIKENQEKNNLADQNIKLKQDLQQLAASISELNKKFNAQSLKLSDYEKQTENSNNEMRQMTSLLSSKVLENSSLSQKLQSTEREVFSAKENLENQLKKTKELQSQFNLEKDKLKQQIVAHENLMKLQSELQRENQLQQKNLQKQEEGLNEKNTIIQTLKTQIFEQESVINGFLEEIETNKNKKHEMTTQTDSFHDKNIIDQDPLKQFYDTTIQMKSIYDLQTMNLPLKQENDGGVKIQQHNKEINKSIQKAIVVGMYGFKNESNQFLLNSLIHKEGLQQFGLSLMQEGINMKVQGGDKKSIVYLNSKISNNPITIDYDEIEFYKEIIEKQQNNQVIDARNQYKLSEHINERYQDVLAVKQMESDFILENSDILIVTVSKVTLEQQMFINSLFDRFIKNKPNSNSKRIIVVHYIEEFHEKECFIEYIQYLQKIFPLKESSINVYPKKYEDENNNILIDTVNNQTHHLLMGNQHSEAGRVFNQFSLYYLNELIELYQGISNFNISQKFRDYLNKSLCKHVLLKENNNNNEDKQVNVVAQQKDLVYFNEVNQTFTLKQGVQIDKIQDIQMNVFGCNQNDLKYSIVNSTTPNERLVLIDIPAGTKVSKKFDKLKGDFILRIQQTLDIENELGQIQVSSRGFEERQQTIKIGKQNELWNLQKDRTEDLKNGLQMFVFTRDKEDEF